MEFRVFAPSLIGLTLALSFSAFADHHAPRPKSPADITDPAVFVPPVRYRSVFADTPTGVEQGTVDWKQANSDVGEFRNGFVDILKWESAQEAAKAQKSGAPTPPAATAPAPSPAHKH
jgi:hypothetical protein